MDAQALERMLANGKDTPLLRFGLGKAYLDASDTAHAIEHFRRCVELDPKYSAAWKLLGKALLLQGDQGAARLAWESGIAASHEMGDRQAGREMEIFLRRLDKA
nr:tetratricopeptide repeat protein [uncultured Cupriavidus sp.]